MIRSKQDLLKDVKELRGLHDLAFRKRKTLSKNIFNYRKQIEKLEEMILEGSQYELYEEDNR